MVVAYNWISCLEGDSGAFEKDLSGWRCQRLQRSWSSYLVKMLGVLSRV